MTTLVLTAIFQDNTGMLVPECLPFLILLEVRMMEVVVSTGAIMHAKFQSNRHRQQTNTQLFTDWLLPIAQPTMSKH